MGEAFSLLQTDHEEDSADCDASGKGPQDRWAYIVDACALNNAERQECRHQKTERADEKQ
jgi:hypothetical protein